MQERVTLRLPVIVMLITHESSIIAIFGVFHPFRRAMSEISPGHSEISGVLGKLSRRPFR